VACVIVTSTRLAHTDLVCCPGAFVRNCGGMIRLAHGHEWRCGMLLFEHRQQVSARIAEFEEIASSIGCADHRPRKLLPSRPQIAQPLVNLAARFGVSSVRPGCDTDTDHEE